MIHLFREGGADKVIGQRLGAMEQEMFQKVGANSQLYLPSLPEVNKLVGAKAPMTGKIPVTRFEDAWTALQELRALRRSALSQTEPMKHMDVLRVTAALESDLKNAMRSQAPDAVMTFEAHKKIGRELYAVAETLKGSKIFSPAPRAQGGRVDLNPLLEEFMAPGIGKREPLMQELIESGAGDLIHGVLPAGAKAGAADVIHAGRGLYARTRFGEGTATGALLPFPESRRFAVPPPGSDILRPLGTTAAGQAAGEGLREVQVPGMGP
jgi:tellurite resistance protein